MHRKKIFIFYSILFIVSVFIFGVFKSSFADSTSTADALQQQIDQHTSTIQQLQQEISQYQDQLNKTAVQAKTLQSAVTNLDLNSKKLQTNIKLTQTSVDTTNLKIDQLGVGIDTKQNQISDRDMALGETIRSLNENDSQSLVGNLLIYKDLGEFWQEEENTLQIQGSIKDNISQLQGLKQDLETNKSQSETQRDTLLSLKNQLAEQETSVELNKKQQAQLLTDTKNKESAYQSLISDRKAKEAVFEKELNDYEAQLKLTITPGSYPTQGAGILSWPVSGKHIITQFFGNTDFSATHQQLYGGQGHNGIDIGVPIGTPIMAALDGVVKGTGNTDLTCPGASFGKWVMVEHPNGLSSLYAHLSLIKATTGEKVSTGDILGYSGMTGYATGPHLHFTVYATQGVEITSFASKGCPGHTYTMPIADLKAYLNPLAYLVYP